MGISEFKPTRTEVADVRRFAFQCELQAMQADQLERAGMLPDRQSLHRAYASDYSGLAFRLSQRVAMRGGA